MSATAGQADGVRSLADRFGFEPSMVVMEMGYDDDLLPGLKEFGELRLLPVVLPKLPRLRRLTSTPGQEHLFDRYGYVPGVYELDAETAPAVIALLNEPGHVQPGPVLQVLPDNAVGAGDGTKHGYP